MKRYVLTALMLVALQGCAVREPMPAEHDADTPTLTPRA